MRTRRPGQRGDDRSADHRSRPVRRRHEDREQRTAVGGRRSPSDRDAIYGRNAVAEALAGRRSCNRLMVAEGVREDARLRAITARAAARGVAVDRVPRLLLDDLVGGANHQGIVLEAKSYPYAELDEVIGRQGTVLVLDHLQDPQNFGTLLRAAEAVAVAGVVIARDRAVGVTPAVVNASAGAVEHLLVAQETNLARSLDRLIEAGWWAVGVGTGEDAVDLYTADVPTPVALVIGSEGTGLSPIVRGRCQLIVSLPMRGKVASLNAATAGAIALFELIRRELR